MRYGTLQTTKEGAKKIQISANAFSILSSQSPHLVNSHRPSPVYAMLTERVEYDLGGACTTAQYKGTQVILDDTISDGDGFRFAEYEDGIIWDGDEEDAADNLIHLNDQSFLPVGTVFVCTPIEGLEGNKLSWVIDTNDYQGAWQISKDPEDNGKVIVGAHRSDVDYPWTDGYRVRGIGIQADKNSEAELLQTEPEKITPPDGAGYLWYTFTVTFPVDNEQQPSIEGELGSGSEVPEEEFENTVQQGEDGNEATGSYKYTRNKLLGYYIKSEGKICNLVQLASGDTDTPEAFNLPTDNNKLKEDLDIQSELEAGCHLTITGTDTQTINLLPAQLAGVGLTTSTGTCTALDFNYNAPGCIDITGTNTLTFTLDSAGLAGNGLSVNTGTGCEALDIGAGCGIIVNADDIEIDGAGLAGVGLDWNTGLCQFDVTGTGAGGKVYKVDVTNTCTALSVTTNTGVTTDTYTIGFDATGLAGNGLVNIFDCELSIGAGCGITVNADDIEVKMSDLAGDGLTPATGTGCQGLDVDVGCGLTTSAGKVVLDVSAVAGDGLGANTSTCEMEVDAGQGLTIDGNLQLDINGLVFDANASFTADFFAYYDVADSEHKKIKIEDIYKSISGYNASNVQILAHESGTIKWFDTKEDCSP